MPSMARLLLLAPLLAACSQTEQPPPLDSAPPDLRHEAIAPDAGPPLDLPPAVDIGPDADASSWPDGFSPQPRNVPAGYLCTIPADYVVTGGDPVNPPCEVEADSFSVTDPNVMPSGLKLVTWNVEYGKKAAAVTSALTTDLDLVDADILLLQEVPRQDKESDPPNINLARDLAQALKMNYVFAVEWDRRLQSSQGGEHGLALLTRYPIGNVELIRHTPLYNFYAEKKHFGGRATLGADILVGGVRVRLYNAHLCTRDLIGTGREKQGAEILADATLAGRPQAQLLGGDLNTFLCNPQLLTCNKPPWAEPVIQLFLNDGWSDLLPSFNSWTQMGVGLVPQRLDWLFARQATPVSGQVLQGVSAADHVPVSAVVTVP